MNPLTASRVVSRRLRDSAPGYFERAFALVVLFLSTGGLMEILRTKRGIALDDQREGDPFIQIIWLVVYGITLLLLVRRARAVSQLLARERLLVLLCTLGTASVLWSVAPDVTLRRTVGLLGTTAFGVYLGSRYTAHELLRLMSWMLAAAAALSLAFVAFAPAYGIDDEGAWRGIFAHKNFLGHLMALAIVGFLFELRRRGAVNRLAIVTGFAVACLALLGSRSVAGLVTALVVVVTMPLWPIFRLRRTLAVAAAVFALMAIATAVGWLITSPEQAAAALGKDATLTGRTGLWFLVADAIAYRPWFGYGYGAFWLGPTGESAAIWAALSWQPAEAHNGFLDLGLQLGMVGVVLFLTGFAIAVWRAVGVIRRTDTAYALWPMACLTFIVIANLAETMILVWNSIFWILYVVTCVWLIRAKSDASRVAA